MIPIDLPDMGRSMLRPYEIAQPSQSGVAGTPIRLDVTIAVRSQLRLQTEHGKCLHL
jgi:hypothetical protein